MWINWPGTVCLVAGSGLGLPSCNLCVLDQAKASTFENLKREGKSVDVN